MRPILFRIGSFPVSSYQFIGIIGVILGFVIFYYEAKRQSLNKSIIINVGIIATITGFIGAKIQHILFDGFFEIYLQKPVAMLKFWKGGYAVYGSVVFALPAIVLYLTLNREKVLKYLDAISYSLALGISLGRVGCFLNGCCFGNISVSPLALTFLKSGDSARYQFNHSIIHHLGKVPYPVIPTQIISTISNFIIFLFLFLVVRKKYKKDGTVFGLWLALYAIFRFIIEYFRSDDRGMFFGGLLSTSQIIAVVALIVGILLVYMPSGYDNNKSSE